MIRTFTTCLALAALAASGPASMLHVHAYAGHDHPEHHHGPAAHSHQADHDRHQHETPGAAGGHQVESCDPGEHVVSVVVICVSPTGQPAPTPGVAVTAKVTPPAVASWSVTISDVRAHSPPRLTDAPLRAPPVIHPA